MHKVSTINLNGRAYQMEEAAYKELQDYLRQATATLQDSPDKDEILLDIEQAVAEKCDQVLAPGKNVVTSGQMSAILAQMGEVEAADDSGAAGEKPGSSSRRSGGQSRSKRLFVIREDAMLLGVCQGISAYAGVDVAFVRLAFAALVIFTGGFWLLVYVLLGLLLPVAKTEAELAEAHGKPVTAQEIVDRARERAPDSESLRRLSDAAIMAARVATRIVSIVLFVAFGIVTAAWLAVQSAFFSGQLELQGELMALNGWRQWLALLSAYLVVALPLYGTARVLQRCAAAKEQSKNMVAVASETSLSLLWGAAVAALIWLAVTHGPDFRSYIQQHNGYLDIGEHSLCVDDSQCGR